MQLYKYESLPKIDINDDESVDRYIEFCKKIFPKNRRTIKRTVAPKFLNYQQQEVWEMEEIRKIIEGDGILCGKMYFYFNYCKIKHTKEGTIRPEFRVPDNEWFRLVESCDQGKENQGKGIICLKARRGGFSWKEAADVIHDAILNTGITIGMNANSEASSRDLFSKVKFIYDNLPNFLRPSVDGGKSRDHIKFGIKTKDEFGNSITEGHNSEIFCVAPTDSAFEGRALRKWVFDEVGKTKNSLAMFSLTEPCLELGRERVGVPIFFGTAGEIEKGAMGQHEFFMKHEVYNLERFLFAGWMDRCDKFGNPLIEENVWSIINTRRRLLEANAMTKYLDALQQYPLNSSEALMSKEGHGIGNVKNIQQQLDTLTEHIVKHEVGYFTWGSGEGGEQIAVWNPDPVKGTVHMWERPRRELHKGYVCGCLPAGEKVLTDKGLMNIEEVSFNESLVSKDGNYVEIKELQRYDINDSLHEIHVSNTFRSTKFTGEHPIYISEDKKGYNGKKKRDAGEKYSYQKFDYDFLEARYVKKGQWIKYPNIYKKVIEPNYQEMWDSIETRVDRYVKSPLEKEDFWWFIGLWLGDGSVSRNGKFTISCNVDEKSTISRLINIIEKTFNRSAFLNSKRSSCVDVEFNFKQLATFIVQEFGKYSYSKKMPEWVKYLPHDFKKAIIAGYIDSDGCVTVDKRRNHYVTEIVSINLEMMESLQDMLFSLGVISSVDKLRDKKESYILGKKVNQKETYRVRISHYWTRQLVEAGCDSVKLNNTPLLENCSLNKHGCQFSDDYEYIHFQIKDVITTEFKGYVYNFHCETSTYLCRNITTHNCDPADHDYVNTRASDLSTMIIRKQVGSEPPKLVCSYTDRPALVDDYYEQAALALIYYNETKCLIEDNRYGMIKWFKSNGLTHLLKPTPIDHKNIKQKYIPRYGIRKTEQSGKEMERCINEYTDQYIEGIYDIELLKEFKKYGTENTDRVIAFGWACVSLQDEYRPAQTVEQSKTLRPNFMSFKKVGGKIVRR